MKVVELEMAISVSAYKVYQLCAMKSSFCSDWRFKIQKKHRSISLQFEIWGQTDLVHAISRLETEWKNILIIGKHQNAWSVSIFLAEWDGFSNMSFREDKQLSFSQITSRVAPKNVWNICPIFLSLKAQLAEIRRRQ